VSTPAVPTLLSADEFARRVDPPGCRLPQGAYFEGAPNLAVEVVSENDREAGIAAKVQDWLDAGADRVWEVRPRTQTITVHRRGQLPRPAGIGDTLVSDDASFRC